MSYSAEGVFFMIGCFVGTIVVLLLIAILPIGNTTLEQCAKQHNVYACEYVAVPKKEGGE